MLTLLLCRLLALFRKPDFTLPHISDDDLGHC